MPRPTHPYLKTSVRGSYYYLYMILDVWSRKVVGFEVFDRECSKLAAWLIKATCQAECVGKEELALHADNGGPMKGSTMVAMLQKLEVMASFSRPSVSNDNPYSESAFGTMKYRPDFPSKPFGSLKEARAWVAGFVRWYNQEHLHSSIRFVSPEDRHNGRSAAIFQARKMVYAEARRRHPERWRNKTRNWSDIDEVILNPEPEEEVKSAS